MLGKFIKHELKETAKHLIPLNLILVLFTVVGCILVGTGLFHQESVSVLSAFYIFIYILSIFALFIITGVYLTIRFWKTMYSNQGYLTHTLPVSTGAILNTKILVSAFWVCAAFIITVLSIFALVRVSAGDTWHSIDMSTFKYMVTSTFGIGYGTFWLYIILTLILSSFSVILMIFASLSIGQLFSQHRILGSAGAFVVLYMIQQIAGIIALCILSIQTAAFDPETQIESAAFLSKLYHGMFTSALIELIFFIVVFYGTCYYLTKKKLNLE